MRMGSGVGPVQPPERPWMNCPLQLVSSGTLTAEILRRRMSTINRIVGTYGSWLAGVSLAAGLFSGCVLEPPPDGTETDTPDVSPTPITAPDGVVVQYEDESNNVISSANALAFPVYLRGSMGSGDTDYFTLNIPQDFVGYKISLAVLDSGGDCFYGVDPFLDVLTSDGRTTLYHSEDSFETYCPTLNIPVKAGDSYLLRVGTLWGMYGSYTLSVLNGGSGSISGTISMGDMRLGRPVSSGGNRGNGSSLPTTPKLQSPVMPGELIVWSAHELSLAALRERIAAATGLSVAMPVPVGDGRALRIRLTLPRELSQAQAEETTRQWATRLRQLPGILSIDVNRRFSALSKPNDTYFSEQWDMGVFPGMNMVAAWDLSQGSSDIIVAVGDTGDDPTHPELKNKSVAGYDLISDAGNAGDGDGVDNNPTDSLEQNHGAHVAGTIAAETDNGAGVASVGWNVRYMPLRVCGNIGCTESDIADAIGYAAGYAVAGLSGQTSRRADAINLSLGGHDVCSPLLQDVIRAANVRGVAVVVAAGNEGDDAADYSPASCEGAIAVGASNQNADRASFSNYGDTVAVIAPGENILSTVKGGYAYYDGTSMATPHIAGVIGLLRSINPTFLPETMLTFMQNHLKPIDCGVNVSCGGGVPDVAAVLQEALNHEADVESLPDAIWVEAINLDDSQQHRITTTTTGSFLLQPLHAGSWQVRAGYDRDGSQTLSTDEILYQDETLYVISEQGEDLSIALQFP